MSGRHLARVAAVAAALTVGVATSAAAWDDVTGDRDMPWLGGGGRARLLHDRSTCIMCPTGYTLRERWGRSRWSGEDPYTTVAVAMRFLATHGIFDGWPASLGDGEVSDGHDVMTPRAAPYRFTVVQIEPTVVVMRFDLGALLKLGGVRDDQQIGTPRLGLPVEYGTRLPATGTLLWFAPDVGRPPEPVAMPAPDRAEITAPHVHLVLERHGDDWIVVQR